MQEEWRDIPGFSPYQASNLGKVRNSRTGNILSPYIQKSGYVQHNLRINGVMLCRTAHRLVALAFLGEQPIDTDGQKYDVNHKDGNRSNNVLSNLEYLTKSENIVHSYKLHPYCERNITPRPIFASTAFLDSAVCTSDGRMQIAVFSRTTEDKKVKLILVDIPEHVLDDSSLFNHVGDTLRERFGGKFIGFQIVPRIVW